MYEQESLLTPNNSNFWEGTVKTDPAFIEMKKHL